MPSPAFDQFVESQESALAKSRVKKTLVKPQGFNSIFTPRYVGIERLVTEGRTIVIAKNGERQLLDPKTQGFLSEKATTKIGMDFAEFVIKHRTSKNALKSKKLEPSGLGRRRGL